MAIPTPVEDAKVSPSFQSGTRQGRQTAITGDFWVRFVRDVTRAMNAVEKRAAAFSRVGLFDKGYYAIHTAANKELALASERLLLYQPLHDEASLRGWVSVGENEDDVAPHASTIILSVRQLAQGWLNEAERDDDRVEMLTGVIRFYGYGGV